MIMRPDSSDVGFFGSSLDTFEQVSSAENGLSSTRKLTLSRPRTLTSKPRRPSSFNMQNLSNSEMNAIPTPTSNNAMMKPIESSKNNNNNNNNANNYQREPHSVISGANCLPSPHQQSQSHDTTQEPPLVTPSSGMITSSASTTTSLSGGDSLKIKQDNPNEHRINIDFTKISEWLMNPVSEQQTQNGMVQCQIHRSKGGFGYMYAKYEVFLSEGRNFLMFAEKHAGNKTANYTIHSDPNDSSDATRLGKVRANFLGTEFVLYDGGLNPEKKRSVRRDRARKEIGSVIYAPNILGSKGPRKMVVLLPKNHDSAQWQPVNGKNQLLLSSFKRSATQGIRVLENRSPRWNPEIGAYVLNFNGRVTQASVKNFQLEMQGGKESDQVILQFGKIGKDQFTMDFRYPLSAVQAFAICLTSLDTKLACE